MEAIDRAGPGGNYLQDPSTMANFKKVVYSDLFDRTMYDTWQKQGARRFEERLKEMTLGLIGQGSEPLAADTVKQLDELQAGWAG